MNKSQLIDAIAKKTDLTKAASAKAVDAMVDAITSALKEGDPVSVPGFGTFSVKERAARIGRNPRTGDEVHISAATVPSFKAGKGLKEAL